MVNQIRDLKVKTGITVKMDLGGRKAVATDN